MTTEKLTHGGVRKGAGAPKKEELAKNTTIKLTDQHKAAFRAIGGMKWLRAQLDAYIASNL